MSSMMGSHEELDQSLWPGDPTLRLQNKLMARILHEREQHYGTKRMLNAEKAKVAMLEKELEHCKQQLQDLVNFSCQNGKTSVLSIGSKWSALFKRESDAETKAPAKTPQRSHASNDSDTDLGLSKGTESHDTTTAFSSIFGSHNLDPERAITISDSNTPNSLHDPDVIVGSSDIQVNALATHGSQAIWNAEAEEKSSHASDLFNGNSTWQQDCALSKAVHEFEFLDQAFEMDLFHDPSKHPAAVASRHVRKRSQDFLANVSLTPSWSSDSSLATKSLCQQQQPKRPGSNGYQSPPVASDGTEPCCRKLPPNIWANSSKSKDNAYPLLGDACPSRMPGDGYKVIPIKMTNRLDIIDWKMSAEHNPLFASIAEKNLAQRISNGSDVQNGLFWVHLVRYEPQIAEMNKHRTVHIDHIPKHCNVTDVLREIRFGSIESINLCDIGMLRGRKGPTPASYQFARIVFLQEQKASDFQRWAHEKPLLIGGRPVRVYVEMEPTYPRHPEVSEALAQFGMRRIFSIIGLTKSQRMRLPEFIRQIGNFAPVSIEQSSENDGKTTLEFRSILHAYRVLRAVDAGEYQFANGFQIEEDYCRRKPE